MRSRSTCAANLYPRNINNPPLTMAASPSARRNFPNLNLLVPATTTMTPRMPANIRPTATTQMPYCANQSSTRWIRFTLICRPMMGILLTSAPNLRPSIYRTQSPPMIPHHAHTAAFNKIEMPPEPKMPAVIRGISSGNGRPKPQQTRMPKRAGYPPALMAWKIRSSIGLCRKTRAWGLL